jgi:hypothetical protein
MPIYFAPETPAEFLSGLRMAPEVPVQWHLTHHDRRLSDAPVTGLPTTQYSSVMLITNIPAPGGGVRASTSVDVLATEAGSLQQQVHALQTYTNHSQGKATQNDVHWAVRAVKSTGRDT